MDGLNQAKIKVENDINNVYMHNKEPNIEQFVNQTLEDQNMNTLLSMHSELEIALQKIIDKMYEFFAKNLGNYTKLKLM